jgi:hypothetical protein
MVDSRIEKMMADIVASHHQALGRVAASWAKLEYEICLSIWRLAAIDSATGACMTSQILGAGRLLETYIALAKLREIPKQIVSRLHKFQEQTYVLSERRNRLIHDSWTYDPPGATRWEIRVKGKLTMESRSEAAENINAAAVAIDLHSDKLRKIVQEISATARQSPRRK